MWVDNSEHNLDVDVCRLDSVVEVLCAVDGRILVGAVDAGDSDVGVWMREEHQRTANFHSLAVVFGYHHAMRL